MLNLLALHMPGFEEWIVIAVVGVLLFGKKLPEVGRSLGKGIVEFKKGLKGIDEEVERATNIPAPTTPTLPVTKVTTLPAEDYKFDPITGKPLIAPATIPPDAKFDPFTGKPIESNQPATASVGMA